MIQIELGNVQSKEQAQRIEEKISGQTYYNFQVDWAPMAGNYPVTVSTDHETATEDEVKEMLLFVLACEC